MELRDPLELFREWFQRAENAGIRLPETMTLATCTAGGQPSARTVLLKQLDERGFVFFTNLESRKSGELRENPRAALVLHWPVLDRQVRVEGAVARVSDAEAAAYFKTRPRESQLSAWASRQSAPLETRDELEKRVGAARARFTGRRVRLPPHWGGWRVIPACIEFWQGQPGRLHDRLVFVRQQGTWDTYRLYP